MHSCDLLAWQQARGAKIVADGGAKYVVNQLRGRAAASLLRRWEPACIPFARPPAARRSPHRPTPSPPQAPAGPCSRCALPHPISRPLIARPLAAGHQRAGGDQQLRGLHPLPKVQPLSGSRPAARKSCCPQHRPRPTHFANLLVCTPPFQTQARRPQQRCRPAAPPARFWSSPWWRSSLRPAPARRQLQISAPSLKCEESETRAHAVTAAAGRSQQAPVVDCAPAAWQQSQEAAFGSCSHLARRQLTPLTF